ncbi:signal transduction histidine kinase [Flavobacterium gossypii]|uniref:histidine kinase n=1 Tax=Flavobacterium gossypii TaxID=1646119 RepID=A0ABR6DK58_9FLAO|nr:MULTISPECIES: ATP-binding protein [Flavobacterium]MBA9072057.1 signal transduction histidine kinase [Flavobacterium gossypii]WDO12551.1 histidine kinase [Flavobacterium sp. WW92]
MILKWTNFKFPFWTILLFFTFSGFAITQNKTQDSLSYYIENKDYLKGLKYSREKSKFYLENKDYKKYCDVSLKKADIYFMLNDNQKSFETLFKALKIAEEHNITKSRMEILEDIGHRYASIRNYDKAKNYYYKSLSIGRKNKLINQNSFIYQRLFKVHIMTNSDSAFYYMEKIMKSAKELNDPNELAFSYNNYYSYYITNQKYHLARKYLDSSMYYSEKSNNIRQICTALSNLGYHYLVVEKNYKKGIEQYLKSLAINPKDTISQEVGDTYLNLSYGYEMVGDYKNAIDYMNKYFHVNETIYEDNIKRAISDVETKYKIEKIENENKEKQRLLEEKQKNNQKIILIFIALFAFSTILFYFFYQNLRLKQKNKFIEFDRQIKQNIINATIDGQEIERKNIATILHDSISALLSSAGLHLSAYSANNPTEHSEEIQKTRAILKEAHDNVRDLSHELIPPLLAKFGIFHALQDLCEKNSNSILQFEYSSYVPQGKRYNEEFEMRVYFIIAELFNNIMKHSKASKAYITLEENGDQLLITIEDDGKGFDTSKELSSDGFGLTQIKSRIKHLKGSITINSKINAGTLIYIKIQISKA